MFTHTTVAGTHAGVHARLKLAFGLLCLALLLARAGAAHASTTIVVSDYTDGVADGSRCPGSTCRLRDALAAANNGDTVTFGSAGHTISLTQGEFNLAKDLTIMFSGSVGDITLDAQSASRIFNIAAGATVTLDTLFLINGKTAAGFSGGAIRVASTAKLNLNNITVEFSQVSGSGDVGGAIYNLGTLTITNFAFFMNNQTAAHGDGGAIYNDGTATLSGTAYADGNRSIWFFGNSATLDGGTIYNNGTLSASNIQINSSTAITGGAILNNALLAMDKSLVVSNVATGAAATAGIGGGIENSAAGTLTVSDSSVSSNHAKYIGAGITSLGALTLDRSLVYNNSVGPTGSVGGGIVNASGTLTMVNTTVSTNSAPLDGGGIFDSLGSVSDLNNVTITRNTADSDNDGHGNGGGIYNGCPSGEFCIVRPMTVTVRNTIIAANFDTPNNGGAGAIQPDCHGPVFSEGYNLLRIDTGCSGLNNGINGDQVGTSGSPRNALLADLAENGGWTPTHALLPASPAIDKGNPLTPGSGGLACALLDQRDYPRGGAAGRCDIGAYERVFFLYLPLIMR